MYALKTLTTGLAALAALAVSAQDFADQRYKVKLTLSGSPLVVGGQELTEMLASSHDQNAVFDTPPPILRTPAATRSQ